MILLAVAAVDDDGDGDVTVAAVVVIDEVGFVAAFAVAVEFVVVVTDVVAACVLAEHDSGVVGVDVVAVVNGASDGEVNVGETRVDGQEVCMVVEGDDPHTIWTTGEIHQRTSSGRPRH